MRSHCRQLSPLGMQSVVRLAATINVVIASVAVCFAFLRGDGGRPTTSAQPMMRSQGSRGVSFWTLLCIALITGYISLSYEVIWFREFVVGLNRAPAFALILGTYLTGLGLG